MEINEFIEKFADIFDDMNASSLIPQTKFHDLDEWSSLSSLGIIALADEEFGVEISGPEIKALNTIQDLFDLINSK